MPCDTPETKNPTWELRFSRGWELRFGLLGTEAVVGVLQAFLHRIKSSCCYITSSFHVSRLQENRIELMKSHIQQITSCYQHMIIQIKVYSTTSGQYKVNTNLYSTKIYQLPVIPQKSEVLKTISLYIS